MDTDGLDPDPLDVTEPYDVSRESKVIVWYGPPRSRRGRLINVVRRLLRREPITEVYGFGGIDYGASSSGSVTLSYDSSGRLIRQDRAE